MADMPRQNVNSENVPRDKPQDIFITFSEPVSSDEKKLKAFLLHRMAPLKILFDVRKTKQSKDGTSKLVLRFASKTSADEAVNSFHQSNKTTTSKIHCSFSKEEDKQQMVMSKVKAETKFDQHMTRIAEAAKTALDKHDIKIREANNEVRRINEALDKSQGLSFEEFDMLSNEKGAREDKLNELSLQRKEFQSFLSSMRTKCESLKFDTKFETKLNELRKYLGVECHRLKCALPMYARRKDILNVVKDHQVSVILGETGSGKSTQMVQYLYQARFADNGIIACTQPRKIAAVSLAMHVASEMASCVGQTVGYRVGMQKKQSAITKILYMTDHVLLNECLRDNNLSEFSCLIIDEAHERSIYTDLLLGMIKACLRSRPDLKVIVTSATINPGVFVSFFGGPDICPVLKVSGRTFPVTVFYKEDEDKPFPENHEEKAVTKAVQIHTESPITDGDILVFLTSPLETEKSCEKFEACMSSKDYKCMQLHGKLQAEEQKDVFLPTPLGTRKIVFATNSAETSITIPGIRFVIDTGLSKEMRFDPKKNTNTLSMFPVTKSSAEQRKGRAGRMAPGTCYRLFSEKDFNEMEPNTKPEILRVHLGQALLKLLELGVNPLEFDFVESPPKDSLQTAMNTLTDIQAVKNGCITELGKWIAKLPLEPRLGVLVKNGIDKGVAVESMVIAACCTSSGIFFRIGSEAEKSAADVRKTQFCHAGGDLLTMLNAFRAWYRVDEKAKGKWCNENNINGKSMKGVRETVNEILTILRKEMEEEIKFSLRPGTEVDQLLQCLVIDCMKHNVCCFLGHEQAGYVTGKHFHCVQVHPSSSLKALGQIPRLVVYWQLLHTTKAFVTNLTPVDEEILDANGFSPFFDIDIEGVEKQRVSLAGKIPTGKFVFKKFVGPMYKYKIEKEERLRTLCNDTIIIIEANREIGEIQLFCNDLYSQLTLDNLEEAIHCIAEPLTLETVEAQLGSKKSDSGIRAVIGAGGSVQDILMPYQFRTVKIRIDGSESSQSEDEIRDILTFYGQIENLYRFKASGKNVLWGKATFCRQGDAQNAFQKTREVTGACDDREDKLDQEMRITLIPEQSMSERKRTTIFTLKLCWVRRSSKGIGYVTLDSPEDKATLLAHKTMSIDNSLVEVRQHKSGNIFLKGFHFDVTEESVVKSLAELIGVQPDRKRFKVVIPRNAVDTTVDPQKIIKECVMRYVPEDSFKVNIKDVNPTTVRGSAFVTFTSAEKFQLVADKLTSGSSFTLHDNPVTVAFDLKSSIYLNKNVYESTKDAIQSYIEFVRSNVPKASIAIKVFPPGNVAVGLCASSSTDMAFVKAGIHKVVDGDSLDCATNQFIDKLFTRNAREHLKVVEREEKAVISIDDRTMTVRIQGSSESRAKSLMRINEYLGKMANASEKQVSLKGPNVPIGLMKAMLVKYGTDLWQMQTDSGLLSVNLNHRYHSVTLTGEQPAIEKATSMIDQIKNELDNNPTDHGANLLPECPVCLCEIELSDLTRLEYCGHAYCQSCLKLHFQSALQDKQFPILCCVEDCNKPIVQKDIRQQIGKGVVDMKQLALATVSSFVGKNKETFRYCITPDCEMVYRVSDDGRMFQCGDCDVRVCTSCHIQYHDGLTCAMYQLAKTGEESVDMWIKERPTTRKRCPKCKIGIEKTYGCNHMTCTACNTHICWVCLAYFSTGSECYGHLQAKHSSFV